MKSIKLFGRTIPIAIILIIGMVGIGSAAVLLHFATLTGSMVVPGTMLSIDSMEVGGSKTLEFNGDGVASFTINNPYEVDVLVLLETTITLPEGSPQNYDGIMFDYSVINSSDMIESGGALVPQEGLNVVVNFDAIAGTYPGIYTIRIDVDPFQGYYNPDDYT